MGQNANRALPLKILIPHHNFLMEQSELQNNVSLLKPKINQVLGAAPPASSGLQPNIARFTRTSFFFHLRT